MSLPFFKIRLQLVEGVPGSWQAAGGRYGAYGEKQRGVGPSQEARAMKEVVGGKLRWLAIFEASAFS